MLSVIRSLGNVHIHAISANNEDVTILPQYEDVTYYPVYNWRVSFLNNIKKIKMQILSRGIEYLFYHIVGHLDHYMISVYEKEIHEKCKEIIRNNHIDAIFTVCLRFYTHRIGMKLTKETGIKWLQFWVDPYSNKMEKTSSWWRKEARLVEKKYFEATDKIYALPEVFKGNLVIDDYRKKLVTFEIPYLDNKSILTTTKDVVFAGGFIKRVREPEPVLNLLLTILGDIDSDVRFLFYVKDKSVYNKYERASNGRICFHDYVNHEELNRVLGGAMMLLNIGNYHSVQMPSKTVEYVSYRKPLLFFFKDKNDASLRYLNDYPDICRICVDDNDEINIKKLTEFFSAKHDPITYDSLMKIREFRESTPEFIRLQMEI